MQPHTANAARGARAGSAPKPRGKPTSATSAEQQYASALECVKRHRFVTLNDLRTAQNLPTEVARQFLLRMQGEGVVGEPDMFGVYTRAVAQAVTS